MASKSNNKTPPDPMISSGHTLIPAIRRRRKHRNPGIAVAFRLKGAHKKHSASNNNSSPVNFGEGFQKSEEASARKLAAGLWQGGGGGGGGGPSKSQV
ncbi:hypothetical protein glysoja_015217 [Glycine soja]|nr:hypothetical protein glysoja_015217 [Glycine soja]